MVWDSCNTKCGMRSTAFSVILFWKFNTWRHCLIMFFILYRLKRSWCISLFRLNLFHTNKWIEGFVSKIIMVLNSSLLKVKKYWTYFNLWLCFDFLHFEFSINFSFFFIYGLVYETMSKSTDIECLQIIQDSFWRSCWTDFMCPQSIAIEAIKNYLFSI